MLHNELDLQPDPYVTAKPQNRVKN